MRSIGHLAVDNLKKPEARSKKKTSRCSLSTSGVLLLTSVSKPFWLLASRFGPAYLAVSSALFDNALRFGGEALSTATTAYA